MEVRGALLHPNPPACFPSTLNSSFSTVSKISVTCAWKLHVPKQLDCSDVHFDALWRLSPLRSGCCQWLPTWLLLAWATHVRSVASQMTEVSMETRSLSSPCTCLTSGSVHAPTRVKRIGDQAHPVLPWPVAHSTTFVDTPWCVWDGCSLRLEGPVHSPMGGSMAAECRTAH